MRLFEELIKLPKKCVYGLFNYKDKKVYIGYSSNIFFTLSRLISSNTLKEDWSLLELKILESFDSSNSLRIRYQYWSKYYSNQGFSLYRKYKAVQYKLREEIIRDLNGRIHFSVKLISKGYKEILVGVFNDHTEMKEFVKTNYSNIDAIVYADNELTKRYVS